MLDTDTQTDFVEIRFAAGLPGFPHVHNFHLKPWGPPGSPYLLLRAVDDDVWNHTRDCRIGPQVRRLSLGDCRGERIDGLELLDALGPNLSELTADGGLIVECLSGLELVFHDHDVGMDGAGSQFLDLRLRHRAGHGSTREKCSGNGGAEPQIDRGFHIPSLRFGFVLALPSPYTLSPPDRRWERGCARLSRAIGRPIP